MKKIMMTALCMALLTGIASGCVSVEVDLSSDGVMMGRGDLVAYTFDVADFTEIRIEIYCNIDYYSAPSDTVTLEIHSNLIEYMIVEESGGVLTVRSTRGINFPSGHGPVLTVGSAVLNKVTLAGFGDFKAYDTISGDSFSITMAGAGKGEAELDVRKLHVNMLGAGNFQFSGTADNAEFVLGGAGNIEAIALQTRIADVTLAGVGSVRLSCSEKLNINAGGVGSVEYKGHPEVDTSRGGLVSVRRVES